MLLSNPQQFKLFCDLISKISKLFMRVIYTSLIESRTQIGIILWSFTFFSNLLYSFCQPPSNCCCRVLAVGCKDTSTRLYCLDRVHNFRPITLGSQNDTIVAVFFESNSLDVTTIARLSIYSYSVRI